jgi:serine protease DegQ
MFMRKTWLIFSQTVTVAVGVLFVVATFRPQWLSSWTSRQGLPAPTVLVAPSPAASAASAERQALTSFRDAARKAAPTVVSVSASNTAARQNRRSDPWFRYFFGDQESQPQSGVGSGFIVTPDGYIVTNNHVAAEADGLKVTLQDGRVFDATVVGTDPQTEVALLKVDATGLPTVTLGDSDKVRVGEWVLAVGSPFGLDHTVTSGIVSAQGRSEVGIVDYANFIQTDAAINPGNSGGPLINLHGEVIGMNTAILSSSGGSNGIGFAIPVSTARQVMESLIRDGQVTRGWIGVEPRDLTPEIAETFNLPLKEGVLITGVLHNGPAALGGVRPGDVVVEVASQKVANTAQLLNAVAALKPGEAAQLRLLRGGQSLTAMVTVAKRPRMALPAQPQQDDSEE